MSKSIVILFCLVICIQFVIIITLKFANKFLKKKLQNILISKMEIELKFLRNQINLHFLFNKLNNIYGSARKQNINIPDMIMKLSNLLRRLLNDSYNRFVDLRSELKVLDDFINLEKIRVSKTSQISFIKEIDNDYDQIAPLILLTFLENAFKYFEAEEGKESYVHISLKINKGLLCFNILNSRTSTSASLESLHIGLTNIKRQLQILYEDYKIDILNEMNSFKVLLYINLRQYAKI